MYNTQATGRGRGVQKNFTITSKKDYTLGQKQGEEDMNSKIVEKSKIMNLSNCFQSPVMNQNRLKDFCVRV